jgi:hypothetical protein
MRSLKIIFLICFSLFLASAEAQLSAPVFSSAAGYYPDSIFITISSPDPGISIHYTLNGNEPTLASPLYSAPVLVKSRAGQPNTFSMVPTNPSFGYPVNGYDTSRADSRGWLPPYGEVYKQTVLKAKAFKTGFAPGPTAVATYFIDPLLNMRYSFPVLSISTDSADFFSDSTGIYVYGLDTADEGNYSVEGTEKMVHVQFFETDGSLKVSQYCAARNHGGGGRHAPQKSLALIARSSYGCDSFGYQFFPDKSTAKFKSILLRNGGHRPDCFPRDDLAGRMVSNMSYEVQDSRYVVVFVNGEYWGVQTIKDIFDEHYIANKYHINKSNIAILELGSSVDDGLPTDNIPYIDMRDFAVSNDMTVPSNYAFIKTQMDVDNYIDYQASEIYFGNGDWPHNNIKYWRYRTAYNPNAGVGMDGRWRWMLYDIDAGFGGDCTGIYPSHNALSDAVSTTGGSSTLLLRALLVSPEFKDQFINRAADLLNTEFLPSRLAGFCNNLDAEISPELLEHVNRWRYPSVATDLLTRSTEVPSLLKWNDINADLLDYMSKRPGKLRNHYMMQFALADTVDVTVKVNDTLAGRVKISTLIIDENTIGANPSPYPWKGKYFTSIPVPLKAIPRPGYRFVNWLGTAITNPDTTVLLSSDTSFTAVFAVDTSFHPLHYLYLNELCARNINFSDEYREKNDWFEIYNPQTFPVDVDGYYLTDSLGNKMKFRLTSGSSKTVIPAKGFLLLWADEQKSQGPLHVPFKLSAAGEELALVLPDGKTVVDSVIYGPQGPDKSWGRQKDGDSLWIVFNTYTPGRSNMEWVPPLDESLPLNVYPNPAKTTDKLFLSKPVAFSMYDYLGRKVLERTDKTMFLSIAGINPGVYFIRTTDGEVVRWIRI